jgi:hypothetical protein
VAEAREQGVEAFAAVLTAEDDIRKGGTMHSWTSMVAAAAEVAHELGAHSDAIRLVDMLLLHGARHGETYSDPKALLTRSAVHVALGDPQTAEDDATESLVRAEGQGNSFFAERARHALAAF